MQNLKKYTFSCFFLFTIFVITGYGLAEFNEEWALEKIQMLMKQFEPLLSDNPFVMFLNIFLHNAFASLVVILTFFSLGLTALISLFSNGVILGIVVNVFQQKIGLWAIIASIAPHGIIELPTFLLTIALAFRLAFDFAKSFSPKNSFRGHFSKTMKVYFKIILPLLLIAALIESFITPLVMKAAE